MSGLVPAGTWFFDMLSGFATPSAPQLQLVQQVADFMPCYVLTLSLVVLSCRRALLQAKQAAAPAKPQQTGTNTTAKANTTAPAKKEAGNAQQGRTAAPGAAKNNTNATGQGARPGVGRFEFIEPDRPTFAPNGRR